MSISNITADDNTYSFEQYRNLITNQQDEELFDLFCYGNTNTNIQLNIKQQHKLRKLTLLSLCEETNIIQFDTILKQCRLQNIEEVESLIVECLNEEIIIGKIDSKLNTLLIQQAISRDQSKLNIVKMKNKIQTIISRIRQIQTQLQ